MNARMFFLAVLGILALYGPPLAEWTESVPVTQKTLSNCIKESPADIKKEMVALI